MTIRCERLTPVSYRQLQEFSWRLKNSTNIFVITTTSIHIYILLYRCKQNFSSLFRISKLKTDDAHDNKTILKKKYLCLYIRLNKIQSLRSHTHTHRKEIHTTAKRTIMWFYIHITLFNYVVFSFCCGKFRLVH